MSKALVAMMKGRKQAGGQKTQQRQRRGERRDNLQRAADKAVRAALQNPDLDCAPPPEPVDAMALDAASYERFLRARGFYDPSITIGAGTPRPPAHPSVLRLEREVAAARAALLRDRMTAATPGFDARTADPGAVRDRLACLGIAEDPGAGPVARPVGPAAPVAAAEPLGPRNAAQAAKDELWRAKKEAKAEGHPLDANRLSGAAAALYRQQRGLDRAWDVDHGATAPAPVEIE